MTRPDVDNVNLGAVTAAFVGATKLDHLDQALAALDLTLDDEECAFVEEPYQPHPLLGHG